VPAGLTISPENATKTSFAPGIPGVEPAESGAESETAKLQHSC